MKYKRTGWLTTLLALLFVLLAIVSVSSYALGWITFHQSDDNAQIEVKTGEIREAISEFQDKSQTLLDGAGETLEDTGESLQSDTDS